MTVRELIEALRACPADMRVVVGSMCEDWGEADTVYTRTMDRFYLESPMPRKGAEEVVVISG